VSPPRPVSIGIRWRRPPPGAGAEALALVVLGVSMIAHPAGAQAVRYSGGLQYATGSYVFDARSHVMSLNTGLTFDLGRFEGSVSLPVIFFNGGVVTMVGDRLLPTGGEGHGMVAGRRSGDRIRTHGGGGMGPGGNMQPSDSTVRFREAYRVRVGDPFVRAGGELFSGWGTLRSVRVTVGAKIPTSDLDVGVGTGEWDFTLGGSATASLGSVFLMGDLGYWWFGDLPDLELRDGFSYGGAAAVPILDRRGTLMASFSGASRAIETLDPPLSLSVAGGYRLDRGWSLSAGLAAGLTEAAADLSVFLGWSKRLRDGR
jgi:hypothetical protein